jgi:hypothetical protein
MRRATREQLKQKVTDPRDEWRAAVSKKLEYYESESCRIVGSRLPEDGADKVR